MMSSRDNSRMHSAGKKVNALKKRASGLFTFRDTDDSETLSANNPLIVDGAGGFAPPSSLEQHSTPGTNNIDTSTTMMPERVWVQAAQKYFSAADGPRPFWEPADVLSTSADGKRLLVRVDDAPPTAANKGLIVVDRTDAPVLKPEDSKLVNNLTELDGLNEPTILEQLKLRYLEDHVYTFSREAVVSVNPFAMHGLEQLSDTTNHPNQPYSSPTAMPHLYVIAERAYQTMMHSGKNASIVISGISGAGKTVAGQHIVAYLVERSQRARPKLPVHGGLHSQQTWQSAVEDTIVQSNPLLEAFGNAVMGRENHNSSRFGRLTKLAYGGDGILRTFAIDHLLLETSRLVDQRSGESNFHVLYQMFYGLSDNAKKRLGLDMARRAEEFSILAGTGDTRVPENDAADFVVTNQTMDMVGFLAEQKNDVWMTLAVVMHLGNLDFVDNDNGRGCRLNMSDPIVAQSFNHVVELMGYDHKALDLALTRRTMPGKGPKAPTTVVHLSATEAHVSRNGMIRVMYASLFDWLVKQLCKSMMEPDETIEESIKFVAILEMVGLETMGSNGFEQLCINYGAEVVQKIFNDYILGVEARRLSKVVEGFSVKDLHFEGNDPVLSLFDERHSGVFPLLDEQVRLGLRGSEQGFMDKFIQLHNDNPHFERDVFDRPVFTIKHYAGKVTYFSDALLLKNQDAVERGALRLLISLSTGATSPNRVSSFVLELVDQHAQLITPNAPNAAAPRGQTEVTVSLTVRRQMADLRRIVRSTAPYFVQCIKPNSSNQAARWNGKLVAQQLRFLGITESLRVRRQALTLCLPVFKLIEEYEELLKGHGIVKWKFAKNDAQVASALLTAILTREDGGGLVQGMDWQVVGTNILLCPMVISTLDRRLLEKRARDVHEAEEEERTHRSADEDLFDKKRAEEMAQERQKVAANAAAKSVKKKAHKKKKRNKIKAELALEQERKAIADADRADKLVAKWRPEQERVEKAQARQFAQEQEERRKLIAQRNDARRGSKQRTGGGGGHRRGSKESTGGMRRGSKERRARAPRALISTQSSTMFQAFASASSSSARAGAPLPQTRSFHQGGNRIKDDAAIYIQAIARGRQVRQRFHVLRAARSPWGFLLGQHEFVTAVAAAAVISKLSKKEKVARWRALENQGESSSSLTSRAARAPGRGSVTSRGPRGSLTGGAARKLKRAVTTARPRLGRNSLTESSAQLVGDHGSFLARTDECNGVTRRSLVLVGGVRPRILIVVPATMEVEKQVNLARMRPQVTRMSDHTVHVSLPDGGEWEITDVIGGAEPWLAALVDPEIPLYKLLIQPNAQLRALHPVLQGSMMRRDSRSHKTWRERFFVLQGHHLVWYKRDGQTIRAQGHLMVNNVTMVFLPKDEMKPFCFDLRSPMYPEGLRLQCKDSAQRKAWLKAICQAAEITAGQGNAGSQLARAESRAVRTQMKGLV